jgi:class 3 adenylate cyclase
MGMCHQKVIKVKPLRDLAIPLEAFCLESDLMATEDLEVMLTAIFSSDVAGYSRLMGEDEVATVKTLASYREVMACLVKQHRGGVTDSPGNTALAEC